MFFSSQGTRVKAQRHPGDGINSGTELGPSMLLGHGITIDFKSACGSRFGFHGVDGKFRADDFAVMAVDAIIRFHGFRGMVALFVETAGKGQDAPGTEFDAVAAPLATVIDDTNRSFCNINDFGVKRNTPEFHVSILFYSIQIPEVIG
jgi:hypothetical protein